MPATDYQFETASGVPVVAAPAEIDATTAGRLHTVLLEWRTRGHATLVLDLTGTRFCDLAGMRVLERAHELALAEGGELHLVIPASGAVPRVFTLIGLHRVIPWSASREQALAARETDPADDGRSCQRCGTPFVPRREHARFCTAACRAAWNREHMGDPAVEASAIAWSVTAMSEAAARLPAVKVRDRPQALAAIEEAVWWITMVDATLVRHHPAAYDAVLAAKTAAERRLIKETLAGLRFARNWAGRGAGLGEIVATGGPGAGSARVADWAWRSVPSPALSHLSPRGEAWERARYRAYQIRLAGRTIGETLGPAATFLTFTGADAAAANPGRRAARS